MAEPVFKLLRCDAEASHMLGWAKKEVRRLVDFARLDAFNRTWKFGDVSVKAQYFGGVARLWLEAAGTERMAVWATLPNPVPWRGLSIARAQYGVPSKSVEVLSNVNAGGAIDIAALVTLKNSTGEFISSYASAWSVHGVPIVDDPLGTIIQTVTYSMFETSVQYNSYLDVVSTYIPPPPGAKWVSFSGTLSGYWNVNEHNVWTGASGSWTDLGYEAILAADIAAGTGGEKVFVITSDGEVLAQEVIDRTTHADIPCVEFTPEGSWVSEGTAVAPYVTAWTGGNRVAMYHNMHGTLAFDHWLDFEVPEDVAEIPVEFPPSDQLVASALDPYAPRVPLSSIESYMDERVAGREAAKARRAAWFKKNSDDAIQSLRDGALPEKWDYRLKYEAPESSNTYRPVALSVVWDDEIVSDTTANMTQAGTQVHKRTVNFTYTVDVDGVPTPREATVVGTLVVELVDHKREDGSVLIRSELYTLDNYYSPTWAPTFSWPPTVEQDVYHQFLKDGTEFGMGLLWNGTIQANAGLAYFPNAVGNSAVPTNNFLNPISGIDILYSDIFPPMQYGSTKLVGTAPEFVREYHKSVKPAYKKGAGNTDWLSSSLMPGMTVTVVPIAPVMEDAPLGIYGEPEDVAEVAEVEIYGSAVFSYNYDLGEFVFVEWKPLPGEAESARIPTVPDGWNGHNALIIYGGIKWDDVKEDARAQRKALNDPNDPAHDPLMKAVLDALTPQE